MRDEIFHDNRLTLVVDGHDQAILIALDVENRLPFHTVCVAPRLSNFVQTLPLRPPRDRNPRRDWAPQIAMQPARFV